MEKTDLLKLAIDDSRNRVKAWHDLILHVDKQASDLLRLYVPLIVAAVSFSLSSFGGTPAKTALAIALVFIALVLVAGAVFCFKAIDDPDIELPGEDGDFWIWAMEDADTAEEACRRYIERCDVSAKTMLADNEKQAKAYGSARRLGVAAPVIGFIAGGVAYLIFTGSCSLFLPVVFGGGSFGFGGS